MKNKPLTISLLVAVVAIWAWIIFSVFDYMESPEVAATKKKTVVSTIKKETNTAEYVLALNYKDPFLKKEYFSLTNQNQSAQNNNRPPGNNSPAVASVKREPKESSVSKPEIPAPTISYVGRIQNAKSNKPIAILQIADREYMMQVGEENNGVMLKKIMSDSVQVMFSKKMFYVKKH